MIRTPESLIVSRRQAAREASSAKLVSQFLTELDGFAQNNGGVLVLLAMGAVLRAYDTKLSRVVAVKVMAPELAANPTAVKRFQREASAAAQVHHDHVVTIHAVEESHRPPYLVMQFVMLVFIVFSIIPALLRPFDPKRITYQWAMKSWARLALFLFRVKVTVRGSSFTCPRQLSGM